MRKNHSTRVTRGSPDPAWSLKSIAGLVVIVLAGLSVFAPVIHGEWLMDWDDNSLITGNLKLRSFAGLGNIWMVSHGDYWPLTYTFLWIEWHLFGSQPMGYHLGSLALHIFSGILLWHVLTKIGLRWGWLGGLLFVVHPLSVESVGWISEIKNTLSLPFFLLSCSAYIDFERAGKESSYRNSLVFFLAAMLTKTSVVMLPIVLLLYCWWRKGRVTWLDLKRTAPYFLISIVLGAITIYLQVPGAASDVLKPLPFPAVIFRAGQAIFFYLGSFLIPFNFCLIYPRWNFEPDSLLQILPWPLLAIFLGLLWTRRKTWGRHVLLGLGFFLLTLLPVLGFVHMTYQKVSWVADHFAYLPMIGLIGLTVAGLEQVYDLMPGAWRPYGIALVGILVAGLSFESHEDAGLFANEEMLWKGTLQCNPGAFQAHNNLGLIYYRSGQPWQAIDQYRQALQINPNEAEAHDNLGAVLLKIGHNEEAVAQLREALQLAPDQPVFHFNLGTTLMNEGQYPEAIEQLEQAVKLKPVFPTAQNNLGYALILTGHASEALAHFHQALEINPDFTDAHYNLGVALLDLNRVADAENEFKAVLSRQPNRLDAADLLRKAQALQKDSGEGAPMH